MQRTAEAVSLGHPDKTADYISCYILDRVLVQDPDARYAVEVMIKDNTVVLGGEINTNAKLGDLTKYVKTALSEIGYDDRYSSVWGNFAVNPSQIKVIDLIGVQSSDIARGIDQDGWGDQGVFVGYACQGEWNINRELFLSQKLNDALYDKACSSDNLGIDIKTQVTLNDDKIETVIVAIPMLKDEDLTDFIVNTLGEKPGRIIVNGTGKYTYHGPIADCGVTGRKLACDFYSTACPIGGGSPWAKDASKADVTLNIYARFLACKYLGDNDECFVYLSSCIGRSEMPSCVVKTIKNGDVSYKEMYCDKKPRELISFFGLSNPIYTKLCCCGIYCITPENHNLFLKDGCGGGYNHLMRALERDDVRYEQLEEPLKSKLAKFDKLDRNDLMMYLLDMHFPFDKAVEALKKQRASGF